MMMKTMYLLIVFPTAVFISDFLHLNLVGFSTF